jgi:pimeloyl-ACP methyl ester carboxylesterase
MTAKLADRVPGILPAGSATRIIEDAGHFLQLEQPDIVAAHILDFVGPVR